MREFGCEMGCGGIGCGGVRVWDVGVWECGCVWWMRDKEREGEGRHIHTD